MEMFSLVPTFNEYEALGDCGGGCQGTCQGCLGGYKDAVNAAWVFILERS